MAPKPELRDAPPVQPLAAQASASLSITEPPRSPSTGFPFISGTPSSHYRCPTFGAAAPSRTPPSGAPLGRATPQIEAPEVPHARQRATAVRRAAHRRRRTPPVQQRRRPFLLAVDRPLRRSPGQAAPTGRLAPVCLCLPWGQPLPPDPGSPPATSPLLCARRPCLLTAAGPLRRAPRPTRPTSRAA
jgi:hypothetical protein